ncbi:hypothetical protein [Deinococcus fonticola]|uniref:hypothetical protein n=1 Tax=Deinococcus fonticola TaxID=2528713 RepID=UPI00107588D7|nr:hypothetical protein [Deinococcus fonticola]
MTRARKTQTTDQRQRMTVTSGLKELKLLNKRITTRIEHLKAIRTRRSSMDVVAGVNKKDFEQAAREGMQAIQALLARRDAIKAEIVRSNAQSTVDIGGQQMTVAAAIERKRALEAQRRGRRRDEDFVPTQETLVAHLRSQYAQAITEEANLTAVMESEREMRVNAFLNQDRSKSSQKDSAALDTKVVEEAYRAANTPVIDDPLELLKKLEGLEEEVEVFASEVDRVLDEHNATTYIEVPASN